MTELIERIYGCLAGLAIGDAMGIPGELTPSLTRARFGQIEDFVAPSADHLAHRGLRAGQVTDDTQQALAIVKSIVRVGHIDSEDVSRSLIEWFDQIDGLNQNYVGPSTKRAIQSLKEGVSFKESGRWGWTDGSAMRVAPVGFLHTGDLPATVEAAYKVSLPTHATNTAISGAAAVACAISQAAVEGSSLVEIVEAAKIGAGLGERLGESYFCPSIARRIDFAVSLVQQDKSEEERLRDLYDLVGTGLACYEIVPAALALFVMAEGDPMKTILLAVNAGGDSDTSGAIGGAIAGAFRGAAAIPEQKIKFVERVNGLDLKAVAQDLYGVISAQKTTGEF
jgi:ADP-ribosylglycohydrolase